MHCLEIDKSRLLNPEARSQKDRRGVGIKRQKKAEIFPDPRGTGNMKQEEKNTRQPKT